ncbi:MAG: aspartate kinase [Deltaproteobacteria bacterium]|nr:aspartate kinase [Deltaproteobacteria bacterium]
MPPIQIHKFSGSSLESAQRIKLAAELVKQAQARARVIVVATAMAGVTDALDAAANKAAQGDRVTGLDQLKVILDKHQAELSALGGSETGATRSEIEQISKELTEMIGSVALLAQLTQRTRDRILAAGEKLSARLLAVALDNTGLIAYVKDSDTFLETDDNFGEASLLRSLADRKIAVELLPILERNAVPVVSGFCGRAPDGATTTLGRGGADLTATSIAVAIEADQVTLWTDLDGVYSADPKVVPDARVIDHLNYREAAEMSYYGAKLLHPRSMIPVAPLGIPVYVRNSLEPGKSGTTVDGRFTPGEHPVKAISAIREHCLVSVEGKGMAGVPGIAARVFGRLAAKRISVTMISQSSSESTICLAVPARFIMATEAALKKEFQPDMSKGDIEEVVTRRNVGLVAAVGLGMANMPGVAGRVFTALGNNKISILAIAQGSSELNISMAIDECQIDEALQALHAEFKLHLSGSKAAE